MSDTKDTNWRSYVGEKDRVIRPSDWQNPPVPAEWDDVFKCSHCDNFGAEDIDIVGGSKEDSLDCVRGFDYTFRRCIIRGSTTIKSEIDGWLLEDCEVHAQIEVGQFDNYWHPGASATKNGVIRRTYHPGNKVKVTLWNAERPTVDGSDVEVTKIPWAIWFPYFCWRYVAIRTWDKP